MKLTSGLVITIKRKGPFETKRTIYIPNYSQVQLLRTEKGAWMVPEIHFKGFPILLRESVT